MGEERTNLITAPLHASHEQNHTNDTEESSNEVDLRKDFSSAQTKRVYSGRRKVKEKGHEESNRDPE